jgi:hypothetical protein
MSRLTGTDAYGLMEAYNNVYAPQELTEEQVWEEVETWVNDLIEEGYDLSDYTWEEMYEGYIEEQSRGTRTGSNPNISQNPIAQAIRGDGPARTLSAADRSRANARPSSSPTFQNTGGFGRYAPPSAQVKTPAPTTNTRTPSRLTPGVTTVPIRPRTPAAAPAPTNRPAAGAPTRPVATAPATPKPAAPAGGSALDRATADASTPAAFSPKPQSDVGAMITRSQARQAAQTPKPAASAPARPMGGARGRLMSSFDPFDVIKGHLIDEGYADTEESALVIMANMSEEWREEILDEANRAETELKLTSRQRERARNLNQYTSRPIFYGTNANRRRKADNSDPILNKAHKEMTAKRQESHKEKRG